MNGDNILQTIAERAKQAEERRERLAKLQVTSGAALMKKNFPPPQYLWKGILPDAGIAIVAAKKGRGKTFLLLQLADAISKGRPFLGVPTEQSKVLFLELEISERRIQQRFLNMGIVANENLTFAWHWPTGAEGILCIEDYITEYHPQLVVVDMLQHLWPQDADANNYQDTYRVLSPLRQKVNDLHCMVILVTHIRKQDAADPMDGIIGSTGNVGNADVIMQIIRQPSGNEGVLDIRGNDIEEREISIRFNVNPLGFAVSDASPDEITQTPERREILDAIRELGGKARTGEIAAALEKPVNDTSNLLQKLKNAGLLVSAGYGEYSLVRGDVSGVTDVTRKGTYTTYTSYTGTLAAGKQPAEVPKAAKPVPDDETLDIF